MSDLQNKVAIITGAASGLGAADARLLSASGAKVVLTDINRVQGQALADELPDAIFIAHDVCNEADWQQVFETTLATFGRVDVLVNNAGIANFDDIEHCSLETYRQLNAIMSEGTFLGCKYAVEAMKAEGGSIINVSSIAAIKGIAEIPAYSAAKGAILALTRSVAVHCQQMGYAIRCNSIVPGVHETPMTAHAAVAMGQRTNTALEDIKQGSQGRPEDVANLVLFLASSASSNISGAQLVIDNTESIR